MDLSPISDEDLHKMARDKLLGIMTNNGAKQKVIILSFNAFTISSCKRGLKGALLVVEAENVAKPSIKDDNATDLVALLVALQYSLSNK